MITLVRGTQQQLVHYFSDDNWLQHPLWVIKPHCQCSGWQPIRGLVRQLADLIGQDKVDKQLALNRGAASFAFSQLTDQLNQQELAMRHYYSARTSSHLSHNWYLHRPLFDAWAKLLNTLLHDPQLHAHLPKGQWLTVIVPFSDQLIGPANAIIKTLNRSYPDSRVNFVVGYAIGTGQPTDDHLGINWDMASANARFVGGYLQLSETQLDLTTTVQSSKNFDYHRVLPKGEHESDIIAASFARLASTKQILADEQLNSILAAMQLAFDGIDFQNTLLLGLKLLEQRPAFNQGQKAQFHTLLSLAAHNRQFKSDNARFNAFLDYHLIAAYEAEQDPTNHSILCYRLAVLYGRRMKRYEQALCWAQKCLAYTANANQEKSQYLYCHFWGLNIKSYLLMCSGRPDLAYELGSSTFDQLHDHYQRLQVQICESPDAFSLLWQREFFCTVQVVRRNMFTLSYTTRHLQHFRYWLDKMELVTPHNDEFRRATHFEWAEYYQALHQPKNMLRSVEAGFACLKHEPEMDLFLNYSRQALRACYITGDLTRCLQYLHRYRQTVSNLDMPWHLDINVLSIAPIYLRHHQSESLTLIENEIITAMQYPDISRPHRIDLQLMLALKHAHQCQRLQSEEIINQAIELALLEGERNQMKRIARTAGWCNQLLGQPTQAALAFKQALSLAQNSGNTQPCDQEIWLCLIGLQQIEGVQTDLMKQALGVLPQALKQPETWWLLVPALELLTRLADEDRPGLIKLTRHTSFIILIDATAQRIDCGETVRELNGIIERLTDVAKA